MASLKPIKLYSHKTGPNPWKVAVILDELSVPYKHEFQEMSAIKQEPFISVNPNGRVPAIEDPNTGIILWESGAIIMYLIETYDKDGKISYPSGPEKYYEWQWMAYQISGQGPYFGQAVWFTRFHHEQLPSARERYVKEIERVTGVLDSWLQKHDWLVGDKCTYVDLMFVPWAKTAHTTMGDFIDFQGKYKAYFAWMEKLEGRDSVRKVFEEKAQVAQ